MVNSFLLKLTLPYIVEPITFIYNLCLSTNTFPQTWKTAKVIPVPKCKNPSNSSDFRPISILSILSKPLEKHIHTHISKFLENCNLFYLFQSGFRKSHSCQTALTRLIDSWHSSINDSKLVGAIFLDLKKAFDTVDHDILLEKVSRLTFSKRMS